MTGTRLAMEKSHTRGRLMWFLGAPGLEVFREDWRGEQQPWLGLWALTWQTCCARLSPGPGGPAHIGQNTA